MPLIAAERTELKRRTARSILWSYVRIFFEQGFAFAVFAVQARLLTPREIGIFGLAMLFFEVGKLIAGAGFPDAIIREPELDEELADTVFWANLGVSCGVTLLIAAFAPLVAQFFREEQVRDLLWALAALVPISALGSIHNARKLRAFGYRSLAGRVFVASSMGGVLGILAALVGWGPWSLLVQRAVVEIMTAALAWQAFAWRPRLRFARARLRRVAQFSLNVMLTQVAWTSMVRSQDFIIGRSLNAAGVGTYRTAWRAIDLLLQFAVSPFVAIALPTLSRMEADRSGFNAAFLRLCSITALIAFPGMLGFGAIARVAVPALLGDRWVEAGEICEILALLALPQVISNLSGPVFSALGYASTIFKLACLQLAATVVFALLAAPYGLKAIAIAFVVRSYLVLPLQMVLLRRATGVPSSVTLRAVTPPLLAALTMACVVWFALPVIGAHLPRSATLAVTIVGAGLVYAGLLLLFARRFVFDQLAALRSLRRPEVRPT